MEPWVIAVISICSAAAALIVLLFAFAAISYNVAFGKRCDKNPLLKYFTVEDFSLSAESAEVKCNKTTLRGLIYRKPDAESNGKLIVFAHGMGAGQVAYTTEIAYFCNHRFTVLALDSFGCNLSDGKNIKGMYAGVKTAVAAIDFARSNESLKNFKICIVGHSWGGYSALCASAERQVDKVVAVSAPNTPVKTIYDGAAKIISKPLAAMLCPFWYLINLFKFGAKGNANAASCAMRNATPTLLVHGEKDKVVSDGKAVYYRAAGENIEKYLAAGKAHNPYNTVAAEIKLAELTENLARAHKMTDGERENFFNNFDFSAATEEDEEVMRAIVNFLS